jgi:hypothetical protein
MDSVNLIWAVAFVILLTAIHVTNVTMAKSVKAKPLGRQTIFDTSMIDSLILMRHPFGYLFNLLKLMLNIFFILSINFPQVTITM